MIAARTARRLAVTLVTVAAAAAVLLVTPLRSAEPPPWLVDATTEVGLEFMHLNGATGEFLMPEILGAGVALFDADGDGDLDVFLVQSQTARHRLFRNDLQVAANGTRTMRLMDVSANAGLAAHGYGMGVATGDYDGDGLIDLYVTAVGSNTLYRNNGNGTFTDTTADAGVDDERWSTSAAFVDIDGDGHLDLFVANYIDFSPTISKPCFESAGARDYCLPTRYRAVPDRLFRNRGNGTFEDVSERAGILRAFGNGLGVSVGDYDRDGRADIYVANDATPNQLWRNLGGGRFEDVGGLAGVAFNALGRPEGSMGIASGDYDADGDEDLVVANIRGETFVLYDNDGTGGFEDRRVPTGLGQSTPMSTGFGVEWADFDNDGVFDLIAANGAVNLVPSLRGSANPYRERNQLFRGTRPGTDASTRRPPASRTPTRLDEVSGPEAGPGFERLDVGRGLAIGDLDNDGFPDVVITNNGGTARVLRNTAATLNGWVGIVLRQPGPNGFAIGATITVDSGPAAGTLLRVRTDGSYLSASDARVLIGVGGDTSPVALTVTWPDGTSQRFADLQRGRYHTLSR